MFFFTSSTQRGGIAFVSASTLLLAGCGGGGGSTGTSVGNSSPPSSQAATITESQSQALFISQTINGDINAAKSMMKSAVNDYPTGLYSQFVAGSTSSACTFGGTLSASVTDNGTPQVTDAGDSVVYTYTNCKFATDTTINGIVTYTWISATNDPTATNSWAAKFTETWQNYVDSASSKQTTQDGTKTYDMTSIDATRKRGVLTFHDFRETDSNGSPGAYVIQDYADSDGQVFTYSVDAGSNAHISIQNGYVITATPTDSYAFTYATATPFTFDSSDHPTGGAANVIIHLSGSALANALTVSNWPTIDATVNVKWTVIDSNSVKLESDLDNDGSYEVSYPFNFSQL